ncbi:MAG TPA: VCBS repeat-containing protein, partial [Thermoanaerobaculia bacterium]|nr:VCBS repeat-containing protein [Thermoanaerobaculia bacterium]
MSRSGSNIWLHPPALAALAGGCLLLAGASIQSGFEPAVVLAQAPPSAEPPLLAPAAAPEGAAPQATPAPDPMDDLEHQEPPDGKWEQEEDGREYFVTRFRKVKDTYYIYPGGEWVQYKRLYRWPVVKHDDEYIYIKWYRGIDLEVERKALEESRRAEEEARAAKADDYRYEDRRVDRLTFVPFDHGLPRQGQWRQGFDVADINGDGHLDIVHGPLRKGSYQPVVFLGDGAGSWRAWEDVTWPELAYDYGDAAVGDVNGNGLLDVALGIHLRGVLVLIQEEPGRFVD